MPVLEFSPSEGSPSDAQLTRWRSEAAGYKIRHVPATLPDMVQTRAMMEWEYASQLGPDAQAALSASDARLAWMRTARSDYEIALPLHELSAFARALSDTPLHLWLAVALFGLGGPMISIGAPKLITLRAMQTSCTRHPLTS